MARLPAILWIEPKWFKLQTVNMTYDSPFSTETGTNISMPVYHISEQEYYISA